CGSLLNHAKLSCARDSDHRVNLNSLPCVKRAILDPQPAGGYVRAAPNEPVVGDDRHASAG
ncbi:hypothetical protein, partial [Tistrella bauzanensis]|uniref:hypothetical protein n=1 Tax=Tistrella bauzanensis TaxID=657419 RepID=UPI001E370310